MSESNNSISTAIVIPAFGAISELYMDLAKTKEAEIRLVESKMVNAATYADLEYCFNESWRELRNHYKTVTYHITLTDKAMERAKSDVLMDKYPAYMEGKPKSQDNADLRKAFLMRDEAYLAALDRMNMLKAMEVHLDGKMKVMEKTCSYMKLQINLLIRSGTSGANFYSTGGKK